MNSDPQVLAQKLKHYRLSSGEYDSLCRLLGRPPKDIEWPLFSALWSEHCSYKSSRLQLKKFAKTMTTAVLNSEGENAGVVDLGHGERLVFKMESHNHPSYIEPYQGAATGVGGILRDIFTMGARPIALADYLCFGEPSAPRMGALVDGVVRGISGYGNSVGVPTVTGQTNFDASYNGNILVNAMALGLLRPGEKVALSAAKGVGNCVVYVGAKTGRDGVHGAAMASESFAEDSEVKKPNVQIGDPYFEKLLIESCLEVLQKDLVVAIQDMGAAGLTSSSFEMAAKGQVGMRLHLDRVPVRDLSITPEEILLSESQERMLLVCEPDKLPRLQQVFRSWGLDAAVVGEVLGQRQVELWWKGEMLTSIDPHWLVENAPLYERPAGPPVTASLSANDEPSLDILSELRHQNFTSRQAIWRQYDQRVGLLTVRGADYDVAVLRLPDSQRGLALVVGCRPHWMKCNARLGALDSVLYPILQMSLKGFQPIAITDCLNFGNPERPEVMREFITSVDAITEVSLAFAAPVVSGNVSFYNETLGQNIISTPAIGVVGLRPNIHQLPHDTWQSAGSTVLRLSAARVWRRPQQGGDDQGQKNQQNQKNQQEALSTWVQMAEALRSLSQQPGVLSNQMCGRGGLLMTLANMSCGPSHLGFDLTAALSLEELRGEALYEAVFEVRDVDNEVQKFMTAVASHDFLQVQILGQVTVQPHLRLGAGDRLSLGGGQQQWTIQQLQQAKNFGLGGLFESLA